MIALMMRMTYSRNANFLCSICSICASLASLLYSLGFTEKRHVCG